MFTLLAGTLVLATVIVSPHKGSATDVENPRFISPSGDMTLVVRRFPRLGDFERLGVEAYWRRNPAATPEVRGALYRRRTNGRQQLLSEFTFRPNEPLKRAVVADDGYFATYDRVYCGDENELATIHAPDGSVVRTLMVRDVFTKNDQQWLCRGPEYHVSLWSPYGVVPPVLRVTFLATDGEWDSPGARRETIDIDLHTGAVPPPERDRCPAPLLVVAEPDDGSLAVKAFATIGDETAFDAADVVPLASSTLLERAVVRVVPEYPNVAVKAQIAGRVRVEVVAGPDGRVQAARVSALPFGIDQAVRTAIAGWEFAPYPSAEAASRFSGSFIFRFEIVRPFYFPTDAH